LLFGDRFLQDRIQDGDDLPDCLAAFQIGRGGGFLRGGVQAKQGTQAGQVFGKGGAGLGTPAGKPIPPVVIFYAPPTGAPLLRFQTAQDAQKRRDLLPCADDAFRGDALDRAEGGPIAARMLEPFGRGFLRRLGDVVDDARQIPDALQGDGAASGVAVIGCADDPQPFTPDLGQFQPRRHQDVQMRCAVLLAPFTHPDAVHVSTRALAHPPPQPLEVLIDRLATGGGDARGIGQRTEGFQTRDLVAAFGQAATGRPGESRYRPAPRTYCLVSGGSLWVDQDAPRLHPVGFDLDRRQPAGRAWGLLPYCAAVRPSCYEASITKRTRRHRATTSKGAARA
jgi:hypothetical protein